MKKVLQNERLELAKQLEKERESGSYKNYYKLLECIGKINHILDDMRFDKVSDNRNEETDNDTENKITITKEQALNVLACLSNATYKEDGYYISGDLEVSI